MFIRVNDQLAVNLDNVSGIEEYEGTDQHGVILFFSDGYRARVPNMRLDDILSILAGEPQYKSPKRLRTDPDTCLHRVMHGAMTHDGWMYVCVSCESTLSDEFIQEHGWDYDIDRNLYVMAGKAK